MRNCIAMLLLGCAPPALAQETDVSDPASVTVPDLNVPPEKLGDERKFFVFHKPGVTFAIARQDLAFCFRYIARGEMRRYPGFVPWQTTLAAKPISYESNHGLVGVAIMAIISGPLERSIRQSRVMRCMLPRGYARYRISESLWKQINSDDTERSILIQAKIASGPVPPTPRTLP